VSEEALLEHRPGVSVCRLLKAPRKNEGVQAARDAGSIDGSKNLLVKLPESLGSGGRRAVTDSRACE
jgi:hypothetical protein